MLAVHPEPCDSRVFLVHPLHVLTNTLLVLSSLLTAPQKATHEQDNGGGQPERTGDARATRRGERV